MPSTAASWAGQRPNCRGASRLLPGLRADTRDFGWPCAGMLESELEGATPTIRDRIDYLGQLTPAAARDFAVSLDLALLPLAESAFNRSRLPQKFGDHVASGVPFLCSTVGECAMLMPRFPWVMPAGSTREEWLRAFDLAVARLSRGDVPRFDPDLIHKHLSWECVSHTLAHCYRMALEGQLSSDASNNPRLAREVRLRATS